MNANDLNLWINFAINAVLGRLAEADVLMREYGAEIRRAARELNRRDAPSPCALYRGMLLDPAIPYVVDRRYTFVSWSEDADVAAWFACPRSVISEPLAATHPHLRGYIATEHTTRTRVLYHHRWARRFESLVPFARSHPNMGEDGARQIAWSVKTQLEVITEQIDLVPSPAPEIDAAALAALERRLSPPWVVAVEGVRT